MRKTFTIILGLILIDVLFTQSLSWQIVSSMPIPVKGAKAVAIDSLIYIIGGYSDSVQSNIKYIQEYNPRLNTWRVVGYLNEKRSGLIAEIYHDSIIVCGGISSNTPLNRSIEIWGRTAATTAAIYDTNNYFNRIFATAEVYNNQLYLIGGVWGGRPLGDTTKLPNIVEYNIPEARITYQSSNHFHAKVPFHQMSALMGNEIILFGGIYNTVTRDINRFNIANRTYQKLPISLIRPRAGGNAILSSSGEVFIVGGFNETQQSISSTEIFYRDQMGYKIKNGPTMNIGRAECSAVLFDSVLYVFGGKSSNGMITPTVERLNIISVIEDEGLNIIDKNFVLYNNYPNPFNPNTNISWTLSESNNVTLKIFDVLGNEIETLVDEFQNSGHHEIQFDASQNKGIHALTSDWSLSSNIYFYQLRVGAFVQTKSMLMIK